MYIRDRLARQSLLAGLYVGPIIMPRGNTGDECTWGFGGALGCLCRSLCTPFTKLIPMHQLWTTLFDLFLLSDDFSQHHVAAGANFDAEIDVADEVDFVTGSSQSQRCSFGSAPCEL